MINRDELLKMARDAGLFMYIDEITLSKYSDAILERAAVECENRVESVSMHATARDCANFNAGLYSGAASIRALKTENSV